ncbi:hypothetical protein SADUNF_Sadunf05G0174600 [Salix dunnii]|uniref:Uncharacterized protein n=1 Tax=Salix dunnii TaxID=1413687 RepID=A0A835N2E9_9ROSI|nr:hypothetical protein SADUNF_Sadunf05G0174600 [Salix dunnii]
MIVATIKFSHTLVEQQIEEVDKFLSEMDVASIPRLMVCNKVDRVSDVKKLKLKQRENKMLSRICFE